MYIRNKPKSVYYMCAVGELKGARDKKDEFTSDEKGQILVYLIELVKFQPVRSQSTGFLSDG